MNSPLQNGSASRIAYCAMAAAFALFAYLSLVNLDWALFWDDEATSAYLARNWVNLGAPLVDDGRNVYTYRGGIDIAEDGTFRYPQLLIALHALVFAVFGAGETQARALSALLSLAGMALFALALRREFPHRPGFCAVAVALACLAPVTLGYARSATYNGLVLFLNMLAFWSYLQFCARRHAGYLALALAAALAAFYAHSLSGLVFAAALAAFHMLFRREHFDRRAWIVAALGAGVYALNLIGYYFAEYTSGAYAGRPLSAAYLHYHFIEHATMLHTNGVLAWSIALLFIIRRGLARWRAPSRPAHSARAARAERRRAERKTQRAPGAQTPALPAPRDDHALHHLALLIGGLVILSLASLRIGADLRYMSSLAPFAAVVAADVVCWAWDKARAAGAALFLALLLSNAAGLPFLRSIEHGGRAAWTLPALAVEYHREYNAGMRESLDYLRAHAKQDDLVYFSWINPGWLFYYLSDKLRVCCLLPRGTSPPAGLDIAGRAHLFGKGVVRGPVVLNPVITEEGGDPDWLLFYGGAPAQTSVTPRAGGPAYQRVKSFPGWRFPSQRPEPRWHISFPEKMRRDGARGGVQFYKRQ